MVNLSVPYQRPNYALQTLVAELRQAIGNPHRTPEYVTGYKSASNVTGHNADNNGVVHAVDLFFSNAAGNPWTEDRGLRLAEWLRTVECPRGQVPGNPQRAWYIIYRDHIAEAGTGYRWRKRPDGSGYGHWDHIHISTTDLYWGDHTALPAADYDSRAPWGSSGGTSVQAASNITPIIIEAPKEWDEMATRDDIKEAIREVTKEGYGIVDSVWYRPIHGFNGAVSAEARILGTDQAVNDIRAQLGAQNGMIAGLVGALAAVSKGEPFDEAKLLEGVRAVAYEASKAGTAAGFQESIESVEKTTTVTVKPGEAA